MKQSWSLLKEGVCVGGNRHVWGMVEARGEPYVLFLKMIYFVEMEYLLGPGLT